jgi:hypothetical protein
MYVCMLTTGSNLSSPSLTSLFHKLKFLTPMVNFAPPPPPPPPPPSIISQVTIMLNMKLITCLHVIIVFYMELFIWLCMSLFWTWKCFHNIKKNRFNETEEINIIHLMKHIEIQYTIENMFWKITDYITGYCIVHNDTKIPDILHLI